MTWLIATLLLAGVFLAFGWWARQWVSERNETFASELARTERLRVVATSSQRPTACIFDYWRGRWVL